MRTVSTVSAHSCAHSTPGRNNERTRGWSLESGLDMTLLAWTCKTGSLHPIHSCFSHVNLKSFNVVSNDLILTAIVFKQPRSCWVRADQTTSTIQSVCRDHSTLSPKHRTNLSNYLALFVRAILHCVKNSALKHLCPIIILAVLILGLFSPPGKHLMLVYHGPCGAGAGMYYSLIWD